MSPDSITRVIRFRSHEECACLLVRIWHAVSGSQKEGKEEAISRCLSCAESED